MKYNVQLYFEFPATIFICIQNAICGVQTYLSIVTTTVRYTEAV